MLDGRERGRPGDQQPRARPSASAIADVASASSAEPVVHRRHGEQHGRVVLERRRDRARREAPQVPRRPPRRTGPRIPRISPWTWNSGSACATTSSSVHSHADAQRVEVGGDGPPGQHRALGRAGRARRVDDERRRLVVGLRREEAPAGVEVDLCPRQRRHAAGQVGAGRAEHQLGGAVRDDVGELALARLRVDRRDGHAGQQRPDHPHAGLLCRRGPTPPRAPRPRRGRPRRPPHRAASGTRACARGNRIAGLSLGSESAGTAPVVDSTTARARGRGINHLTTNAPRALDERAQLRPSRIAREVLHPAVRRRLPALGGHDASAASMRRATSSAVSGVSSDRSSTPRMIVFASRSRRSERSRCGWADSTAIWSTAQSFSSARKVAGGPVAHDVGVPEAGVQRCRTLDARDGAVDRGQRVRARLLRARLQPRLSIRPDVGAGRDR